MTYMPPPNNLSFLERLGLQKQDESAGGETAQKFYNRSRFADTLARISRAANNLSLEPDANFAARKTAEIAGRKEKRASNETAKFLASKGRDDLAKAILAGSITGKQAFAQYKQEEATEKARKAAFEDQVRLIAERARNRPPTSFEQRRKFIQDNAKALGLTEGTQEYADALLYGTRPPAAKARPTKKDANGRWRYTDGMKELVFADLKEDPETIQIDGNLYQITKDENNNQSFKKVIPKEIKPVTRNISNFVAKKSFTLNGKKIEQGEAFSVDVNSVENLNNLLSNALRVTNLTAEDTKELGTDNDIETESPEDLSSQAIDEADVGTVVDNIDINVAAGGDIAGVLTDLANKGLGLFGGNAQFSPNRTDQKANLNALNILIKPGLTKAISPRGSDKTSASVDKLLPNAFDQNVVMTAKINSLIPLLEKKLTEAFDVINSSDDLTPTTNTIASGIINNYPSIIKTLQDTIANAKETSGGIGASDIEAQADAILGAD